MYRIKCIRSYGWSGKLDPPVESFYNGEFETEEEAQAMAHHLETNDRFGELKCVVFQILEVIEQ